MKTNPSGAGPSGAAVEEARRVLGVHDHGTRCRCLACGDVPETARMLEEKGSSLDVTAAVVLLMVIAGIVVVGIRGLP